MRRVRTGGSYTWLTTGATNGPIYIYNNYTASTTVGLRATAEQLAVAWHKPVERLKRRLEQMYKLQQQGRLTEKKLNRFFDWLMRQE